MVIWEFMELATSSLWPGRIYERISIWQLPRPAPGPTMLPQTVIWAAADSSSFSDKRDLNDLLGFILTTQARAMSTGQDKTGVSTYCECDLHYLGSFSFVRAFCGHSPISIVSSFSNHPQSPRAQIQPDTHCVCAAFGQHMTRAGRLAYVVWGLSVSGSQQRKRLYALCRLCAKSQETMEYPA